MVESSRPFLIHAPKKSRLFSTSTLTTLVITFQGAQALDQVILAFQGNLLANNVSLDKIFSYIALLGLLRLPAAFWITSSYHYTEFNDAVHDMVNKQRKTGSGIELLETDETALIERHETSPHRIAQRFSPTQGWRGMFIRAFYFLFMGGLFTVSLMAFKPWMKIKYPLYTWNASGLGITILYQIISIMTVAILFFCFCSKRSSTTIIPCISHTWYKLYTIFLFAICTAVVIVAAVQTKKTPCGVYTAFTFGSGGLCGNSTFVGTPQGTADIVRPGANWFGIAPSEAFGIALRNKTGSSNETTDVVRIISVQGWCKVKKVESTQYARTMNMNVSTPLSHWWDWLGIGTLDTWAGRSAYSKEIRGVFKGVDLFDNLACIKKHYMDH